MRLLRRRRIIILLAAAALCGVLAVAGINWHVLAAGRKHIHPNLEAVGAAPAAIVLGARVHEGGMPSSILEDRLLTAIDLHRAGKVRKLLLSGDHGRKDYDEVNCMRRFVLDRGIPEEDVFSDHAGFDTYDSMYRARDVFLVKKAIIVTQAFHLPRAVYLARALGIDAEGFPCDRRRYRNRAWNGVREVLARVKAFQEAAILKPEPRFLGPVISIEGDGRQSWDGRG